MNSLLEGPANMVDAKSREALGGEAEIVFEPLATESEPE